MDEEREWSAGLFSEYTLNCCTCCFGTCFPFCALASAKSQFDGSDLLFNCLCFSWNTAVVRHYIRTGYGIDGNVGSSDCCLAACCWPCVITQLLNEVAIRGPRLEPSPDPTEHPWLVTREQVNGCVDPVDTLCTCCCATCEINSAYSQLSGTPLWFGCLTGVNFCQLRHFVRKSYNIGGGDTLRDCVIPTLCMGIPILNCLYFYYEIVKIRGELAKQGSPEVFESSIFNDVAYHSVLNKKPIAVPTAKKR